MTDTKIPPFPASFGRYKPLEFLGAGEVSHLFLARARQGHPGETQVLVTRLRPELVRHRCGEAFHSAGQNAMALSHRNISHVVELGEEEGLPYIVQEHVPGADLALHNKRFCEEGRQWPLQQALFIVSQVALALDHAHRQRNLPGACQGVLHQRVTPENVLLSWDGQVKVTGFGIAAVADGLPSPPQGNPAYSAPEQIRHDGIDARTDVYGCGLLLFEMLTGLPPLHDIPPEDIVDRLEKGDVPQLPTGSTAGAWPTALTALVNRALSPCPRDRFADAAAFFEALRLSPPKAAVLTMPPGPQEVPKAGSPSSTPAGASLDTPLRGHQEARHELESLIDGAAERPPAIIEVVGPPGSGKTRLLLDSATRFKAKGPNCLIHLSGRDLPPTQRYAAVRALVAEALGLGASPMDDETHCQARLRAREFGLPSRHVSALEDLLGVGSGHTLAAPEISSLAVRALSELLLRLGSTQPVLVFVDEADSADQESLILMQRALTMLPPLPLALVFARIDCGVPNGGVPRGTTLPSRQVCLAPLAEADVAELMADLLRVHHVAPELVQAVNRVARGNPRQATELTLLMRERGDLSVVQDRASLTSPTAAEPSIPLEALSLSKIIEQRLKLRSATARGLLEVAACIGFHFERTLLQHAAGLTDSACRDALAELTDARMLAPSAGERRQFTSPELWSLVLASSSSDAAQRCHHRVAQAMAIDEVSLDANGRIRCARHLLRAGLREQARDLLAASGAQLDRKGMANAAVEHFAWALQSTRPHEEGPVALALGLRTATLAQRCHRPREGLPGAQTALTQARRLGEIQHEVEALVAKGRLLAQAGRDEDACASFRYAFPLANEKGHTAALRQIQRAVAELLAQSGHYRRATRQLEEAAAQAFLDRQEPMLSLLAAHCYAHQGRTSRMQQALEEAEPTDHDATLAAGTLLVQALGAESTGDIDRALSLLRDCRNLAREQALTSYQAEAIHHQGRIQLARGRADEAAGTLAYAQALAQEDELQRLERLNRASLAAVDVVRFQQPDALEPLEQALAEALDAKLLGDALQLHFLMALACTALSDPGQAQRQVQQARLIARATGNRLYDCHLADLVTTS
jgi:serine/threonine protein kinase